MISRALKLIAPGIVALGLLAPASGSAAATSPRVVGGSTTSIAKYPWQAALVSTTGGGNASARQFCGGVLVTPSIVLTAAHCVAHTGFLSGQLQPSQVDVVLGRTTLSSSDGSEQTVQATAYQSDYDSAKSSNDAGYLVLNSPSSQATIKIAGPDEAAVWAPGRLTEVSGWGETSAGSGQGSDTLRWATTPIISDSACAGAYGSRFYQWSQVCAGYLNGGVDSCAGDSGGPLQAPIAGGGYRLVGLTSWGDGCAQPNAPGVYTRVAGDFRGAVAAEVSALETAYGLPDVAIVGSGAQPPALASITKAATQLKQAVAKCKRINNRRKRKRCIKRAKRLAARQAY